MNTDDKFLRETYKLEQTVIKAFSDKVARQKQLEWWINREDELKAWVDIIEKAASGYTNHIALIIGSYGRGKTLSLFKIVDEAEKHDKIYPIFLTFKGEEKSKPGIDFILRVFKNINFDKLGESKTNEELKTAIERIPNSLEEAKNILYRIYFGKTSPNHTLLFSDRVQAKSEISKLALYYLRGEIKPNASQMKNLGIIRKLDSIDIVKEYLAAILCFLKNLGYNSLLLAIDEFEHLFSLVTKSQQSIYIALLRSLYDLPVGIEIEQENIAKMFFFIAMSEEGWAGMQEMEKRESKIGGPTVPLRERIDSKIILGTFNKDQTRELIEKRLRYNRTKEVFEDDLLIPFTEDFVDFIYEETSGVPRYITVRCGKVLDAGRAERVPKLDSKFAKRVLEESGFFQK
ncbi:MAG: DUF2791 family P-loop domain-containing protein [Calditrichaceae bacterium]|nr:DUF2791 family P-loop domain-containing protein [Calditrichia bacterium]NUQ42349.1 DUF2791 family P-loop domain-containing protein [Calditrichaceae bacterium]